MQKIIKDILISQMSFPLKYKNEKEIWWEDKWGPVFTIEIIDVKNEQYIIREYWRDGQALSEENYNQGYRHGECLEWYNNGQLCVKRNYHQGRLHGEFLVWYKDGKLNYKLKYNHGKLINEKYY